MTERTIGNKEEKQETVENITRMTMAMGIMTMLSMMLPTTIMAMVMTKRRRKRRKNMTIIMMTKLLLLLFFLVPVAGITSIITGAQATRWRV